VTPREKIFRGALVKIRDRKYEAKSGDFHDQGIATGLYMASVAAIQALKQADEIKDGPNEKERRSDIEWLEFVEDGLPDEYPENGHLGSNIYFDLKRALRKLKKYMGIE